jgi:hypothetical protein
MDDLPFLTADQLQRTIIAINEYLSDHEMESQDLASNSKFLELLTSLFPFLVGIHSTTEALEKYLLHFVEVLLNVPSIRHAGIVDVVYC